MAEGGAVAPIELNTTLWLFARDSRQGPGRVSQKERERKAIERIGRRFVNVDERDPSQGGNDVAWHHKPEKDGPAIWLVRCQRGRSRRGAAMMILRSARITEMSKPVPSARYLNVEGI